MPAPLLSVLHRRQQSQADCLVACAAMLLAALGRPASTRTIAALLGTMPFGTPFFHIARLRRLGVAAETRQATPALLEALLAGGTPAIVWLQTGQLPYWREDVDHAVVVVGIDAETVWLHDPDLPQGPTAVPRADFELAWLDADEWLATIQP
jgi:ABC-type bacteriocin/lantibiotic exporter with double-glycine peptidase domain